MAEQAKMWVCQLLVTPYFGEYVVAACIALPLEYAIHL